MKKRSFDCHLHGFGGDVVRLKQILSESEYAAKYMCYAKINTAQLENLHFDDDCVYFLMPFVIKETDITVANRDLEELSKGKNNIMQIPLVGDSFDHYDAFRNLIGFKEHFLLHDEKQLEERRPYYQYLNTHRLLLVIHCRDSVRAEYLQTLRQTYPDMYIQVAHLGTVRKHPEDTVKILERFQGDDHVYFDISTVCDYGQLELACSMLPRQLLFGTDIPYISDEELKQLEEYFELPAHLAQLEAMEQNAAELLKKLGGGSASCAII